jgi:PGAP1-like protein
MRNPPRLRPTDVLGFGRLAVDATSGVVEVVEAMHRTIAANILPGTPAQEVVAGTTAAVYAAIRAITGVVGGGVDTGLSAQTPTPNEIRSTRKREAMLAALNGIVGDHLAATQNPLAISMRLRQNGHPLELERRHLAAAIPNPGGKLLVLVHGLCMNDLQWTRHRHNHGTALAAELGWTPVQLHFNSGLHISTNGRAFAALLEALVRQWPVPLSELAIIGHSSGGLLTRSAHYYGTEAGHGWPKILRRIIFLGTPHHGSALERGGNWVNVLLGLSPYSAPLARVASIRSAAITDLRYGNLLDEDWQGTDRFQHAGDRRRPVPLPEGVQCFAIAADKGRRSGDGLVSVDSALGRHAQPGQTLLFPESCQWVGHGMGHWDLLSRHAVYQQIRKWFAS